MQQEAVEIYWPWPGQRGGGGVKPMILQYYSTSGHQKQMYFLYHYISAGPFGCIEVLLIFSLPLKKTTKLWDHHGPFFKYDPSPDLWGWRMVQSDAQCPLPPSSQTPLCSSHPPPRELPPPYWLLAFPVVWSIFQRRQWWHIGGIIQL